MAHEGGRRRLDRVLEAGLRLQDMPPQFLEDVVARAAPCHEESEFEIDWQAFVYDTFRVRLYIGVKNRLLVARRKSLTLADIELRRRLLDTLVQKISERTEFVEDLQFRRISGSIGRVVTYRLAERPEIGRSVPATASDRMVPEWSPLEPLAERINEWMRELVAENGYARTDRLTSESLDFGFGSLGGARIVGYVATFALCLKLVRTLPLHDTETRQWLRRLDATRQSTAQ